MAVREFSRPRAEGVAKEPNGRKDDSSGIPRASTLGAVEIPLRDKMPSSATNACEFNRHGPFAFTPWPFRRRHYLVLADVADATREDDLAANRGSLISNWSYEDRACGSAR